MLCEQGVVDSTHWGSVLPLFSYWCLWMSFGWWTDESLGDHAGGGEELPRSEWREAGLGGVGHRTDVQTGAARSGLVSQGLWWQGKSPALASHLPVLEKPDYLVLPISPVLTLNWPSNVCCPPRRLFFQTDDPQIWQIPSSVVFLDSKCCIPLQSGNQARIVCPISFPQVNIALDAAAVLCNTDRWDLFFLPAVERESCFAKMGCSPIAGCTI